MPGYAPLKRTLTTNHDRLRIFRNELKNQRSCSSPICPSPTHTPCMSRRLYEARPAFYVAGVQPRAVETVRTAQSIASPLTPTP